MFKNELVATAYMLAASSHEGQQRKDGTPMVSHCLETAMILASLGLDAETVAASLLHEVLRDNPAFQARLEEFMPRQVVQLVDRVTTIGEISRMYRNNRSQFQDENLTSMLVAMEDVKAVLIKLADRVHNMRTISGLPRDKQVRAFHVLGEGDSTWTWVKVDEWQQVQHWGTGLLPPPRPPPCQNVVPPGADPDVWRCSSCR